MDFKLTDEDRKKLPVLSWGDIKKHNKYNDCWIVSHNKVYDVTEWASRHPGGDIILLGGGLDCTIQLERLVLVLNALIEMLTYVFILW